MAYKKRQRAKKRREMELLMRDNLLNILTVPGNYLIFIHCVYLIDLRAKKLCYHKFRQIHNMNHII